LESTEKANGVIHMIKVGLVAFLDILGYKNIITNNEINIVAELITDILIELPNTSFEKLNAINTDPVASKRQQLEVNSIDSIIVSDSILLTMEIDPTFPIGKKFVKSIFFISCVSQLLKTAFDSGLPLRGAIDYGEFFIKNNTFAGVPIVNSYHLGERLNLSGCALTNECSNEMNYWAENLKDTYNPICFNCITQLKNEDVQLDQVNWYMPFPGWGENNENIFKYVLDKFGSHKKNIDDRVREKMHNTVRSILFHNEKMQKFMSDRTKSI